MRHVTAGFNVTFGKGRAGDATMLAYMGDVEGLGVVVFPPVEDERHGKISSSRIRRFAVRES